MLMCVTLCFLHELTVCWLWVDCELIVGWSWAPCVCLLCTRYAWGARTHTIWRLSYLQVGKHQATERGLCCLRREQPSDNYCRCHILTFLHPSSRLNIVIPWSTYIYMWPLHTYIHMYTYVKLYMRMCVYIYIDVCICIYVYTYVQLCAYTCICRVAHTHTHTYTGMCRCVYTYIHMCIQICEVLWCSSRQSVRACGCAQKE